MPENSDPQTNVFTRRLQILWLGFIVVCAALYFIYAPQLTPEGISDFIKNYQGGMLALYFVACTIRGLTMIPGTPFLLAGIILFKDTPFLLLAVFLGSLLITSALLFFLADKLGFNIYFEKHYPKKIENIRNKLNSRYGFWFILLWSFAPFAPTDLVCYVAGLIRMRFVRLAVPLMIGEAIICAFYIFNGAAIMEYLF